MAEAKVGSQVRRTGARATRKTCHSCLLAGALAARGGLGVQAAVEEVTARADGRTPGDCGDTGAQRGGVCPAASNTEGEHAVEHCDVNQRK